MPQMAPLSWMLLFLTFSVLFLLNMSKIFFTKNSSLSNNQNLKPNTKNMNYMIWKW